MSPNTTGYRTNQNIYSLNFPHCVPFTIDRIPNDGTRAKIFTMEGPVIPCNINDEAKRATVDTLGMPEIKRGIAMRGTQFRILRRGNPKEWDNSKPWRTTSDVDCIVLVGEDYFSNKLAESGKDFAKQLNKEFPAYQWRSQALELDRIVIKNKEPNTNGKTTCLLAKQVA